MTILVVDQDWAALRDAAAAITRENLAVTVVLKASTDAAARFAMYHPVDLVFVRSGMYVDALFRNIQKFQPMAECHILGAGEGLKPFLVPYTL